MFINHSKEVLRELKKKERRSDWLDFIGLAVGLFIIFYVLPFVF